MPDTDSAPSSLHDKIPAGSEQACFSERVVRLLAWLSRPFCRRTVCRWLYLVVLGLVGWLVCLILAPVSSPAVKAAVEYVWRHANLVFGGNRLPAWALGEMLGYGVIFAVIVVLVILARSLNLLRWGHTMTFLLYPPTWVAVLLSPAVWWPPVKPDLFVPCIPWITGCVWILLLLLLVCATWSIWVGQFTSLWSGQSPGLPSGHLPTAEETRQGFVNSPERLLRWLEKDAAVATPEEDLFESSSYAQRIAEWITHEPLGRIGLIGPWGSGKSTVLNLVDYLLHEHKPFIKNYRARWMASSAGSSWRERRSPPRILTCRVGAWGFTQESAAAVVLRAAVAELSKHMDCLSVRSLPEEYLAAIGSVAPAYVHAPLAAMSADSPSKQLQRLDPLLEAINARLIVFIEDLDRNLEGLDAGNTNDVSNERVLLEAESLLDRMSDAKRLSFVLAVGKRSMDRQRLLDHDVELFGVELESVWKVVQAFSACCGNFSDSRGDMQPASDDELRPFRKENKLAFYIASRTYPDRSVEVALANLLRRPRTMKHALRRTWVAWQALHGEVSFEDLLVYSTMHVVSSDAVAFVRDNWAQLASAGERKQGGDKKNDPSALWDRCVVDTTDDEKRWLWVLVKELFPTLEDFPGTRKVQGAYKERYWCRIANGVVEDGDVRDQEILKGLKAWKASGDSSGIVARLMTTDSVYSGVFEEVFSSHKVDGHGMRGRDVLELASALLERMRVEFGVRANAGSCPGFVVLSKLQRELGGAKGYEEWLMDEIEKSLPVSLWLVVDLRQYWGSRRCSSLNDGGEARIREKVVRWLQNNADSQYLCRVLAAEMPWCLLFQVMLLERSGEVRTPASGVQEWASLGNALLDAAQQDPLPMVPQLCALFSDSRNDLRDSRDDEDDMPVAKMEATHTIKRDWIKNVFPKTEDRLRFVEAIVKATPGEHAWSAEVQEVIRQTREQLLAWLPEGLS